MTSHAVFVPLEDIVKSSFDRYLAEKSVLDIDAVVMNQLARAFEKKDGYVRESDTNNVWYWRQDHYLELMPPSFIEDPLEYLFVKIVILIKAVAVFAMMSVFLSLTLHIGCVSIVAPYILISTFGLIRSEAEELFVWRAILQFTAL